MVFCENALMLIGTLSSFSSRRFAETTISSSAVFPSADALGGGASAAEAWAASRMHAAAMPRQMLLNPRGWREVVVRFVLLYCFSVLVLMADHEASVGKYGKHDVRRLFGAVMNAVLGDDPGGFVVIVAAGIEVSVECREIAR